VRSIVERVAESLDVPLREVRGGIAYCGSFFGQTGTGEPLPGALDLDRLVAILQELSPGVTELSCHPGEPDDEIDSVYRVERQLELETLCAPEVKATLAAEGIVLCNFTTFSALS
jgi:predicted glycoside hydrolase/deacetylase ChbG (UPF0249 family)